jgi:hypothetical protein
LARVVRAMLDGKPDPAETERVLAEAIEYRRALTRSKGSR